MGKIKELHGKLKMLLEESDDARSDKFSIKKRANGLLSDNSDLTETFLDEFSSDIITSSDQEPFNSVLHIGNDLRRLIHALEKKYEIT